MEHEPVPLPAPPGFPSHQLKFHGAHPGWYNKYIRAWMHWGSKVVPHEKVIWIQKVEGLRPPQNTTRKVYNHALGKTIRQENLDETVSWAGVVAVMLNPSFVPNAIDSVWMRRVQKKFPHATVLKDVAGYWEQLPVISEAETQPRAIEAVASPAIETPPTGTPATSSTPGHTPSHLAPTPDPRQTRAAADAPFT
ncbi:hypothetical protein NW752_001802 [Fusarium irregulare]|uniref:Uncharacterized protein n=1 Tax=Fusarium irregulare TaxID=2494466 RepID=A0A9W8PWC6_9HYPO|nr:hypothetical protein NW766_003966 [Fusarium irregulare]KAJ4026845.1 hypothetical protein NW752_001802 [Fusarium irregulare]